MTTTCLACDGTGEVEFWRDCSPSEATGGLSSQAEFRICADCDGWGEVEDDETVEWMDKPREGEAYGS